jgi:vacuolar-type H+-ATPase subunit I/STV1
MNNRSKHLTTYTFLIGLLLLSFGFNLVFYNRILILQEHIISANPWMNVQEFNSIEKEINRLENKRYRIVPKGE